MDRPPVLAIAWLAQAICIRSIEDIGTERAGLTVSLVIALFAHVAFDAKIDRPAAGALRASPETLIADTLLVWPGKTLVAAATEGCRDHALIAAPGRRRPWYGLIRPLIARLYLDGRENPPRLHGGFF